MRSSWVAARSHRLGYGVMSIALHWLMGVMIAATFLMGKQLENSFGTDWALIKSHQTIGVAIGVLVLLRWWWNYVANKRPPALDSHKLWERVLARWVAWGFYVLMLLTPLSGVALVLSRGEPVDLWGVSASLPLGEGATLLLRANDGAVAEIHDTLSSLFVVLLAWHLLGVAKHTLWDRDRTLMRMLIPARRRQDS